MRIKIPFSKVDLVCEQGHVVHASVIVPLGVDKETGECEIILGDDWSFCDFCKPCGNFETCMDGEPCGLCLRGWRSEASREAGRLLAFAQIEKLYCLAIQGVEMGR